MDRDDLELPLGTGELADRLMTAITGGHTDDLERCFAPGAVIWHNDDGAEVPVAHVVRTLSWLHRHVAGLRYDISRRAPLPDGYLQQHVLRGTTESGAELALAACLVVTTADGLITRIDEYFDSAATAVLRP